MKPQWDILVRANSQLNLLRFFQKCNCLSHDLYFPSSTIVYVLIEAD